MCICICVYMYICMYAYMYICIPDCIPFFFGLAGCCSEVCWRCWRGLSAPLEAPACTQAQSGAPYSSRHAMGQPSSQSLAWRTAAMKLFSRSL